MALEARSVSENSAGGPRPRYDPGHEFAGSCPAVAAGVTECREYRGRVPESGADPARCRAAACGPRPLPEPGHRALHPVPAHAPRAAPWTPPPQPQPPGESHHDPAHGQQPPAPAVCRWSSYGSNSLNASDTPESYEPTHPRIFGRSWCCGATRLAGRPGPRAARRIPTPSRSSGTARSVPCGNA